MNCQQCNQSVKSVQPVKSSPKAQPKMMCSVCVVMAANRAVGRNVISQAVQRGIVRR
jgi:hypothetical protein